MECCGPTGDAEASRARHFGRRHRGLAGRPARPVPSRFFEHSHEAHSASVVRSGASELPLDKVLKDALQQVADEIARHRAEFDPAIGKRFYVVEPARAASPCETRPPSSNDRDWPDEDPASYPRTAGPHLVTSRLAWDFLRFHEPPRDQRGWPGRRRHILPCDMPHLLRRRSRFRLP
jgi:hypothetical protein